MTNDDRPRIESLVADKTNNLKPGSTVTARRIAIRPRPS